MLKIAMKLKNFMSQPNLLLLQIEPQARNEVLFKP